METIRCPICGGDRFAPTPGSRRDPLAASLDPATRRSAWAVCKGCSLVLQNPRPTAAELERLYSEHAYHARTGAELSAALSFALRRPEPLIRYLDALTARDAATRRVMLDVGCGLGGAVLAYKLRGWDAHGVEPDPVFAGVARDLGLDVRAEFFDADSFPGLEADLIYTCHAFEHFLDPLAIARTAREKISRDGVLFVCVPTFRRARTWAREWFNASHTFLFTDRTLGNLLWRAGFRVRDHRYNAADGELWLAAEPVDVPAADAPLPYREDWRVVAAELAVGVPARAAAWWVPRRIARNAHHLATLLLDPGEFARGLGRRAARRRLGPATPGERDGTAG